MSKTPYELAMQVRRAAQQYEQAILDYALAIAEAREEWKSDETVTKWLTDNGPATGALEAEAKDLIEMSKDPQRARHAAFSLTFGYSHIMDFMRLDRAEEEGGADALQTELVRLVSERVAFAWQCEEDLRACDEE
jgi:hypothetical protein